MAFEPDYGELRQILTDEVGAETMEKISEQNLRDFGNFLITCGEMCRMLDRATESGRIKKGGLTSPARQV